MRVSSKRKSRAFRTAAEWVYAVLKADIIDFKFKPGQKLTETHLSEQFRVSRTPVREALQHLVREGLVRPMPREGYFVRSLDLTEIDMCYEVRIALETLGVTLAMQSVPPQMFASLQEFWSRPPEEFRGVDPDVLVSRDEVFHETIAGQSGNRILLRFLREINQRIRIIRRLDFTLREPVENTFEDHAMILNRIAAGDAEGAVAFLRKHIEESRARVKALAAERLARIYL